MEIHEKSRKSLLEENERERIISNLEKSSLTVLISVSFLRDRKGLDSVVPEAPASSVLPRFCGFHNLYTDFQSTLCADWRMSRKGIQNTGLATLTPGISRKEVCHQCWSAVAWGLRARAKGH